MIEKLLNWILNRKAETVAASIVVAFLAWGLFVLSLIGAVIYVAAHFILKFW